MDRDHLKAVAPHYLAMIAVLFGLLTVLEVAFGGISFWAGIAIAILVGLLYRPVITRLGYAPEPWR